MIRQLLYAHSAGSSLLQLRLWQMPMTQLYVQHDGVSHGKQFIHTSVIPAGDLAIVAQSNCFLSHANQQL
jgi:hypothetical protein